MGGRGDGVAGWTAWYRSPGYEGKLSAARLLPLMLLALLRALRDRRWDGYVLLAGATALTLLGHFQMAYYSLIVAGVFALYLSFEEASPRRGGGRGLPPRPPPSGGVIGLRGAALPPPPVFWDIPVSAR